MYIVGLTGGIATGKSNISRVLKEQGAHVWEADEASRKVVEPSQKGFIAMHENFGDLIFNTDGTLNRERAAKYFFSNKDQLDKLNSILHPIIIDDMIEQVKVWYKKDVELCFIDAPLLFEVSMEKYCDEVWVASCGVDEQIRRVLKRDEISLEDAKKRIDVQMSDKEKRKRATRVIDTSGAIEVTNEYITTLYEELIDEYC
ncbi:MAG: dephospho-CoA kinase [Clostridiales bacterium]|nr:dephospho-CoA kinase [Clostridiales bacterium]